MIKMSKRKVVRITREQAQFLFDHIYLDKKAQAKYPKTPHKWYRNKKEAVREFNKEFKKKPPYSRPSLDKLIDLYPYGLPKIPKKLKPVYIKKFEDSKAYKEKLKDWKYWKKRKGAVLEAFRLLKNKDISTWTVEDMKMLRDDPIIYGKENTLYCPITKMIAPENAMKIRTTLDRIGNYEPIKALEHIEKRPKGSRKKWFLRNDEIKRLFQYTNSPEMLVFEVLELECGGRPSPTLALKVENLMFETVEDDDGVKHQILNIPMYEPKKNIYVDRYFSEECARLIKQYIIDMGLKRSDRLFPSITNATKATKILKEIAKKANIDLPLRKGAGVYILRHTYATQASEHEVSAEVIMDMGGWKTWDVVKDYYLYVRKKKKLREQLGLKLKALKFSDWVKQFVPYYEKRYNEIRPHLIRR